MSRSIFRITNADRVFPTAKRDDEVLFKACLRCKTGALVWDILMREHACINCGWREYESPERDPETQRSI